MHNMRIHETVASIASQYRKVITENVKEGAYAEKDIERQDKAIKTKADKAKVKDEADSKVQIPHKPGHYQFTFHTHKGKDSKRVRRIYQGKDMNKVHDEAKAEALKDYPEAHGFACHSPQCDESITESHEGEDLKPHEKRLRYEEGKKTHINRTGAKVKLIKGKNTSHLVSADSNDDDHMASGDEKTLRNHAKEKDWKIVKESEEVEDKTKEAATDHDEAKETQEDPTREKLETPKDEADEKKGGPAELAADLRVSIRIEKMGLGRYRRMLTKHELSTADETWLKNRINDLEACVKSMEDKLPELEKEAEGSKEAVKESIRNGIKRAILELATGK